MLRFIACSFATLTLAVAPVALHAQEDQRPASDRYTVAGAFGGLSGPDRLNGAGAPDWRQGWAGSVDGTYWLGKKAIRRGHLLNPITVQTPIPAFAFKKKK